ncbi:hypothetical protein M413DRAFT_181509 [Hebeloma cylindrosporum]|uniref:Uncharacterized protein n=1 Tax=Hebeloma cylindrosporum TaxID=76867 RepID=A0A0C3BSV0_HEBCY|nr:hypothetical protein M413DRAFT_181509 [Hebeloma cylindrosporum h7]
MFSTLFTVALFIAPAIQGVFADFAISSPKLVQCKPAKISWEATKGPYNLIVVKASDPCGNALAEVGDFDKTFTEWTPKLKAGTKVQLSLVDANDEEAWSQTITIGDSDDSSCLPGSTGTSSTSSTASTPSADPSTSTPGSTDNSGDDADTNVTPVGAANAGTNPFKSGAVSARQASTPLLAITGLAAASALLL